MIIHKEIFGVDNKSTIRTSSESHFNWKNYFHKNPLYFRKYADFESDKEIDNSSVGNKTTNIYKHNPVLKDYRIESELNDIYKTVIMNLF